MLVAIFVLLLVLDRSCSVAEMGLSRMTKPKAASLADKGEKSAKALSRLVSDPERWVNPLLLTVNICQTVQATLTGIVADSLFGPAGVVVGVVLNVHRLLRARRGRAEDVGGPALRARRADRRPPDRWRSCRSRRCG